MTGAGGNDTFRFLDSDASAVDTITDFDTAANGDKLDLKDLLEGEHANAASLDGYLDFAYDAGANTTTVSINLDGAAPADQQIVLQNLDVTAYGANDNAIITSLLADGN